MLWVCWTHPPPHPPVISSLSRLIVAYLHRCVCSQYRLHGIEMRLQNQEMCSYCMLNTFIALSRHSCAFSCQWAAYSHLQPQDTFGVKRKSKEKTSQHKPHWLTCELLGVQRRNTTAMNASHQRCCQDDKIRILWITTWTFNQMSTNRH